MISPFFVPIYNEHANIIYKILPFLPNLPRALQLRNKIIQSHNPRGLARSISPLAWPISFLSPLKSYKEKNFSARGLVITRELMERTYGKKTFVREV